MSRSRRWSPWILWIAALALLLKSAMPLLAFEAASRQGVPVAEVCPVYGVALPMAAAVMPSMPGMSHAAHEPGQANHSPGHVPHDDGGHAGDHCALTALAALAPPALDVRVQAIAARREVQPPRSVATVELRDDARSWVAGMAHAPPARA